MKNGQLFELLGEMDEEFVAAAQQIKKPNRKPWVRFGALAACLCLICVGTLWTPDGETIGAPVPGPDESITREEAAENGPFVRIPPVTEALTELKVPKEHTERSWMSAELIGKLEGEEDTRMGVYVPCFVTYEGGVYKGIEAEEDALFASSGEELSFSSGYSRKVYSVLDKPDCIALYLNDIQVYQKVFEVTFEMDGLIYAIAYSVDPGVEYRRGETVYDGVDFTVYEAVRLKETAAEEKEYLVNILPLLREYWPDLFGDDQNYADAWQLALPIAEAVSDQPAQETPVAMGMVSPYQAVWGGSYTDATGKTYVLLTEDTPENREMVLGRNPGLNQENTVFLPAKYSQSYLDALLAKISDTMAAGELPCVTRAARLDDRNRIEVTMTRDDPESVACIQAMDTQGGAVEFVVSAQTNGHDLGLLIIDKTA